MAYPHRRRHHPALSSIFFAVAVVVILVAASFVYLLSDGYLTGNGDSGPATSTPSTTTRSGAPSSTTSSSIVDSTYSQATASSSIQIPALSSSSASNASLGLRLDLQLSTNSRGYLTIEADEYDMDNSTNNATASDRWAYSAASLDPFNSCGATPVPLGFAIFSGYYGKENYSMAQALTLWNATVATPCATNIPIASFGFLPQSDAAVAYSSSHQIIYTTNTSMQYAGVGYWTGFVASLQPPVFHSFASGAYTVLAADEWGQVVLLHFDVVSTVTTTTTTSPSHHHPIDDHCTHQHIHQPRLYQVAFHQLGTCNGLYTAPWSVTLGNDTVVQPQNGTVPAPDQGFSGGPNDVVYSTIKFFVPNGVYEYAVNPTSAFNQAGYGAGAVTGKVTVHGANVTVPVPGPFVLSCGSVNLRTSATSTSVSNSSEGLGLDFTLVPNSDGSVTVTVDEYNTLDAVNNKPQVDGWSYPQQLLNPDGNCPSNAPLGFAVFQGYYGMNDFSLGKALYLYNTTNFSSCTLSNLPLVYSFEPMSDSATTFIGNQVVQTGNVSVSEVVGGFWTGGQGTTDPATYNAFPNGVYTIIGADEWGDVILVHITLGY